jgi:hypothetical protein
MALSYVNMDQLSNIASQMQEAVPLLQQYLSEFSTGAGNVTKGWSDDENSGIFSQKITEFSTATTSLITEIDNYAKFMADCCSNKYIPAQEDAKSTMAGG